MATQAKDLSFGLISETYLHDIIQRAVGDELELKSGFETFDYVNKAKTIHVELKTRRVNHNRYETAIIGRNKIEFCNEAKSEYYFFFNYLDGLYYIKYNKTLFDTFETNNNFIRGARADCPTYPQSVVFIPTDKLTRFEV